MRITQACSSLAGYAPIAVANARAGAIRYTPNVPFEVQRGPALERYTYYADGFVAKANKDLDTVFHREPFRNFGSGAAGPGFDLKLFQPDDPLGASGHYSALALIDNPPTTGQFSVDFLFIGAGSPGSQPFSINEYDQTGNFLGTLESGSTAARQNDTSGAPEPGNLALPSLMLVAGGVWRAVPRRPAGTA